MNIPIWLLIGGGTVVVLLIALPWTLYAWAERARHAIYAEKLTAEANLRAENEVASARKVLADTAQAQLTEAHQEHKKTIQRLGELQAALQERERTVEALAADAADWKRKYQQAQVELARLTRPAGSADTVVLPDAATDVPVVAKTLSEAKVTWQGDVPAGTSASGEGAASEAPAANGKRAMRSRKAKEA